MAEISQFRTLVSSNKENWGKSRWHCLTWYKYKKGNIAKEGFELALEYDNFYTAPKLYMYLITVFISNEYLTNSPKDGHEIPAMRILIFKISIFVSVIG